MNKRIILLFPVTTPNEQVIKSINACFSLCYQKVIIKFFENDFASLEKTNEHFSIRILNKIRSLPQQDKVLYNIELTPDNIKKYEPAIYRQDIFIDYYHFPNEQLNLGIQKYLLSLINNDIRIDFNIIDSYEVPEAITVISNEHGNNVDHYFTNPTTEEKIELTTDLFTIKYFMNDFSPPVIFSYENNLFNLHLFTNHRFLNTHLSFEKILQYDEAKQEIYSYINLHRNLLN